VHTATFQKGDNTKTSTNENQAVYDAIPIVDTPKVTIKPSHHKRHS